MNAARTSIAALVFAVVLALGAAGSAAAQTMPDVPTGGSVTLQTDPNDDAAAIGAGSAGSLRVDLAGLTTVVTRVRSGVYLYRWVAPLTWRSFTSPARAVNLNALRSRWR